MLWCVLASFGWLLGKATLDLPPVWWHLDPGSLEVAWCGTMVRLVLCPGWLWGRHPCMLSWATQVYANLQAWFPLVMDGYIHLEILLHHDITHDPNLQDLLNYTTADLIMTKLTRQTWQWVSNCTNHLYNQCKAAKLRGKFKNSWHLMILPTNNMHHYSTNNRQESITTTLSTHQHP